MTIKAEADTCTRFTPALVSLIAHPSGLIKRVNSVLDELQDSTMKVLHNFASHPFLHSPQLFHLLSHARPPPKKKITRVAFHCS